VYVSGLWKEAQVPGENSCMLIHAKSTKEKNQPEYELGTFCCEATVHSKKTSQKLR